jgi:predicted amino acid dehydrogenase
VRSWATKKEIEGWLLACPLAPREMLRLPPQAVYDQIVRTGRLAQKQGAAILGLGGLASVVGDGGVTVARRLNMPVTTGNSLTVASAVEALKEATEERDLALETTTLAVVGAEGGLGLGCAEMLAPLVGKLLLVGQREIWLSEARARAEAAGAVNVRISTRIDDMGEAHVVLSATHSADLVVDPSHLKRRAIVCDLALPPDVSPAIRRERSDVLVVTGGLVGVPSRADFGFELGLPAGRTYASMGEVMILALEGRYESFSLGQRVRTAKVNEISQLAQKHGFALSGDRQS